MKPIRLEIEGLNSYRKKQVIDFEALISKGIFGIFGKTGSGKSTILDAITLSLYGNIARGTKEFINSNSEKASIEYEFQIGEGIDRNTYIVSRRFKRSSGASKSTSRSDYVKLVKKDEMGNIIVIADKVGDVNQAIKEIIGLEESDFLRSVVLPQGKFSEFLSLGGKDRRNMLERIFNLEEYGSKLTSKIIKKRNIISGELEVLKGRLSEYSSVTDESIGDLDEKIKNLKDMIKALDKKLLFENEKLEEDQLVYNLCSENLVLSKELEGLEKSRDIIDVKKKMIDKASKASIILPSIVSLEEGNLKIKKNSVKLLKLENEQKSLLESLDKLKNNFEASKKNYDIIPDLKLMRKDLEILLDKYDEIFQFSVELESVKSEILKLMDKIEESSHQKNNLEEMLESEYSRVQLLKEKCEVNKIEKDDRERVLELKKGLDLLIRLTKELYDNKHELESEKKSLQRLEKKIEAINGRLDKKDEEIGNIIELLTSQEQIKTLDENEFDKMDKQIMSLHKEIGEVSQLEERLNKIDFDYIQNSRKIDDNSKEIRMLENLLLNIDKRLIYLKKERDRFEYENLANKLRAEWSKHFHEGDNCPVCNSKIEKLEINKKIDLYNDQKINKEILALEKKSYDLSVKLDSLKNIVNDLRNLLYALDEDKNTALEKKGYRDITKLKAEVEIIEQLKNEQRKLKLLVAENILNAQSKRSKLDLEKSEIEKLKVELLASEKSVLSSISRITSRISLLENELKHVPFKEEELEKIEDEIKNFDEKEINYEDFSRKLEEAKKKIEGLEKQKNEISGKLLSLQSDKKHLSEKKSKLYKKLGFEKTSFEASLNVIIKKIEEFGFEESNIIDDKSIYVKNLVSLVDNFITEFENKYLFALSEVEALKENLKNTENEIKAIAIENKAAGEYVEKTENSIIALMNIHGFDDFEAVKNSIVSDEMLLSITSEIDIFEKKTSELRVRHTDNIVKLDGRNISDEELEERKSNVSLLKDEIEKEKNNKSGLEAIHRELQKNMEISRKISDELSKKQIEKDNIDSLEKVMRGNRFVEFLSKIYLKNIVVDASKRLNKITNGRYSLEINSEYMFVVRDNYNGGLRRSADTLSGGETFLTSLALALALSSQIQLKGSAPLEFFFLDEGFGTLDEELLDVVMESLENLKSLTLSIGVISHMEEMKNRIPLKLVVEVDQAEMSSKVYID
ncbi:AAA family ATPase [Peptostreptococcus sp. D1]|uniref:AAA family ATPase n=1 Tax=Peptostreptococcus sp. D1 TaxID=72304 RepID=UPI0008DFC27C|nr:AAA family ATPase [Peptostreptococcus sp. D1]SFE51124.1 exonuclease SbcC [Peptostreptococcus sp. D1]